METLKFKTNLKCPNCVAKVKEGLDAASEIVSWSVDLKNPDRILSVETENPEAAAEQTKKILAAAGYRSEGCPG